MSHNSQTQCVNLSLASASDEAGKHLSNTDIPFANLQDILSAHHYSPICYSNDSRTDGTFLHSTTVILRLKSCDVQISDAEARLNNLGVNFIIVSSGQQYEVLLPLSRAIYTLREYKRVYFRIMKQLFVESRRIMNPICMSYGSALITVHSVQMAGKSFDPSCNEKSIRDAWDENLFVIVAKDNKSEPARYLVEKTPILCPFHDDSSPSAFISMNDDGEQFIHCSSCARTYWRTKIEVSLEERTKDLWSYETSTLQIGLSGGQYYMHEIGDKAKFLADVKAKHEKDSLSRYLVQKKHIPHLKQVQFMGSAYVDESRYEVDADNAAIDVYYAPLPADVQDNDFIEEYLDSTFGTYKQFIKEYMAYYCFTNYVKLPTLIFTGSRGTGKNTFAEMLLEIYKSLSMMWHGKQKNFNPEAEMKLLIADETVSEDPSQYRMLKQLSGQRYMTVNKKYQPEYTVANNANIIILSNNTLPIFVEREELPTDERNNQWFVFTFKPFEGPIYPNLGDELRCRLGHYINTELRRVYEEHYHLDNESYRYAIRVPITDAEKALFNSNISEEEAYTDKLIQKLSLYFEDKSFTYTPWLVEQLLPTDFLDTYEYHGKVTKERVIRNMRERGLLTAQSPERKTIDKKRFYCYFMTDELMKKLK